MVVVPPPGLACRVQSGNVGPEDITPLQDYLVGQEIELRIVGVGGGGEW